MPKGGELIVRVRQLPECNTIEIRVIDDGCGIAQEILGRLIDPYYTTKSNGTGLGLALAHKIIDEHRGSIKFESIAGEGTSVIVELPIS
jgi:signal transduction histidine kinase